MNVKKIISIYVFLLFSIGCSSTTVKYQHCSKVVGEWECEVVARFNDIESCKHHQVLGQSFINYNELREKGQTLITFKPSDTDVQTNCIQ